MASIALDQFLSESPVAQRASVPVRVVFRTAQMTPGSLDRSLKSGEVRFEGDPRCDLVAGGQTLATGRIVEREGRFYFQAEERAT